MLKVLCAIIIKVAIEYRFPLSEKMIEIRLVAMKFGCDLSDRSINQKLNRFSCKVLFA
jgi:hypothetical protein